MTITQTDLDHINSQRRLRNQRELKLDEAQRLASTNTPPSGMSMTEFLIAYTVVSSVGDENQPAPGATQHEAGGSFGGGESGSSDSSGGDSGGGGAD